MVFWLGSALLGAERNDGEVIVLAPMIRLRLPQPRAGCVVLKSLVREDKDSGAVDYLCTRVAMFKKVNVWGSVSLDKWSLFMRHLRT